jgi:hypothetical protein
MYTITERLDGTYLCECRVQDGTERWTEPDMESAVASMARASCGLLNTEITAADIDFFREEARATTATHRVAVACPAAGRSVAADLSDAVGPEKAGPGDVPARSPSARWAAWLRRLADRIEGRD